MAYIIVDVNHKIIYNTTDEEKANGYFKRLKDSTPNVHIVLAEIKQEFKRVDGVDI